LPISIKLYANYPYINKIPVYSNKGPGLLHRGDKYTIGPLRKNSSQEPLGQKSSDLHENLPI
jgi:hypothetical protein